MSLDDVVARMRAELEPLEKSEDPKRYFHGTYLRTTLAVGGALSHGDFEDPSWVEHWDVVFADLYLDALLAERAGEQAPRPWRLAFSAPPDLPPLRQVLLGINAHVNYDLPQALLGVISDDDFANPALMARRQRDHVRIDTVLASRVAAEDVQLEQASGSRALLDRVLTPLNRLGSKRFLRESREKVWHNTTALQQARLEGPQAYNDRLAELELLSAARIADLLAPGQVLLKLAVGGFGVVLPPP
jgi:hypothetical protein